MTLRKRLFLFELLLASLVLAVAGVYLRVSFGHWARAARDETLERRWKHVEEHLEVRKSGHIELDDDDGSEDIPFALFTQDGRVLLSSKLQLIGELSLEDRDLTAKDGRIWRRRVREAHPEHAARLGPENTPVYLAVSASLDAVSRLERSFSMGLGLAAVTGVLFSAAVAFLIARALTRPLQRLTEQVAHVEASALDRRLDLEGLDVELAGLGSTFNQLLERLQGAFDRERALTARASHALRTPLAEILAQAEVTLRKTRSTEDYEKALQGIAVSAKEAASMVNTLLSIARAEGSGLRARQTVSWESLIEPVVGIFEARRQEANLEIEWNQGSGSEVSGDPEQLREALAALMDNAVRYTPPGGRVGIRTIMGEGTSSVEVWDTGLGMTEADRAQAFERFYRGSAAEQSHQPGTGLGLSLVRAIVVAHDGTLELLPREGGGTIVRVTLPSSSGSKD